MVGLFPVAVLDHISLSRRCVFVGGQLVMAHSTPKLSQGVIGSVGTCHTPNTQGSFG